MHCSLVRSQRTAKSLSVDGDRSQRCLCLRLTETICHPHAQCLFEVLGRHRHEQLTNARSRLPGYESIGRLRNNRVLLVKEHKQSWPAWPLRDGVVPGARGDRESGQDMPTDSLRVQDAKVTSLNNRLLKLLEILRTSRSVEKSKTLGTCPLSRHQNKPSDILTIFI